MPEHRIKPLAKRRARPSGPKSARMRAARFSCGRRMDGSNAARRGTEKNKYRFDRREKSHA